MNLFRHRPLCAIGAVLLLLALLLLKLPALAVLALMLVALVLLIRLRRHGHLTTLALLLLLALCLSILLTLHHPRAMLRRTESGDTLSFTVASVDDVGEVIGVSVTKNGTPCPFSRISFKTDASLSVGDRVTIVALKTTILDADDADGLHADVKAEQILKIQSRHYSPRAILDTVRRAISGRLTKIGGRELSPLLIALLLGDVDSLPLSISSSFRRLGLSHVLAVSGMHLFVIASFLSRCLLLLHVPRRARCLLVLVMLSFYALAVGGSPSILRALAMSFCSELAFPIERRTDSLSSLFFSGAILCVISPRILLSLSFRLSFLATFGIICAVKVLKRFKLSGTMPRRLYRYVVFPSIMSLSALVFTLPLTVASFGQLSLASILANLLFAPLCELLLSLCLIALCIGPILPIKLLVGAVGNATLSLVKWAAKAPFLLLDVSHPIVLILFSLLALIVLFHLLRRHTSRRLILMSILPTVGALLLSLAIFSLPTGEESRLTILSADGKGEMLLLSTGHERAVIDLATGERSLLAHLKDELADDAVTELSFYLPVEYGDSTLSTVKWLCKGYYLRLVFLPAPKSAEELSLRESLVDYLEREGIEYRELTGQELSIEGYDLTIYRSTASVTRLTIKSGSTLTQYLSGAAAGLLNYSDVPYSDLLILGSRDAVASRLPNTSHLAARLILCASCYPESGVGTDVVRVTRSLTLDLTEKP